MRESLGVSNQMYSRTKGVLQSYLNGKQVDELTGFQFSDVLLPVTHRRDTSSRMAGDTGSSLNSPSRYSLKVNKKPNGSYFSELVL
jgi:hypothetical protein